MDKGASFQDVKKRVEKVLTDEAWKRESRTTDRDSRAAQSQRAAREREAHREIVAALREAETKLQTAAAWWEFADGTEYSAQIARIERHLEELEK